MDDYYQVLQVHPDAESEVIEAAYRRLARKYHPDTSSLPDATRRMIAINVAFDVLGDAAKRRAYDEDRAFLRDAVSYSAQPHDARTQADPSPEPIPLGGNVSVLVRRAIRLVAAMGWGIAVWSSLAGKPILERGFGAAVLGPALGWLTERTGMLAVASIRRRPRAWLVLMGLMGLAYAWWQQQDEWTRSFVLIVGLFSAGLVAALTAHFHLRPCRSRRTQIWERLVGVGFAVMLGVALGVGVLGAYLADSGRLPSSAGWGNLLMWTWVAAGAGYWFGWTWIAWIIAGRIADREARVSDASPPWESIERNTH